MEDVGRVCYHGGCWPGVLPMVCQCVCVHYNYHSHSGQASLQAGREHHLTGPYHPPHCSWRSGEGGGGRRIIIYMYIHIYVWRNYRWAGRQTGRQEGRKAGRQAGELVSD